MILLNEPFVPQSSRNYVSEVLNGNHQQGDGRFTKDASEIISQKVGGGSVLLTPSCTDALEMASMLMNLEPGDEVILPSYTFTSAAIAVSKFGATPVFVDVEPTTKGINLQQVRESITSKTKAISFVNYAGVSPEINELVQLAREFNLFLVEDNAHGFGGTYQGQYLGSFGDFATLSFHATKNIQCGEGGALIVNNSKFIKRAEVIREKGTDRSSFMRGEVRKYQWVDQGGSYLMSDILAAILLGQLENFTLIQERREKLFGLYMNALSIWAENNGFELPYTRDGDIHTAHMFYMVARDVKQRSELIKKLDFAGVQALTHYQSLGHSSGGKKFGKWTGNLQESQNLSERLVRLPLYYNLTDAMLESIVEKVTSKV